MANKNDEIFTCTKCGDTFTMEWSNEEAKAEFKENFGKEMSDEDDICILCDDCYKEFKSWFTASNN